MNAILKDNFVTQVSHLHKQMEMNKPSELFDTCRGGTSSAHSRTTAGLGRKILRPYSYNRHSINLLM